MARAPKDFSLSEMLDTIREVSTTLHSALVVYFPDLTEDEVLIPVQQLVMGIGQGDSFDPELAGSGEYNPAADLIVTAVNYHKAGNKGKAKSLMSQALYATGISDCADILGNVNDGSFIDDMAEDLDIENDPDFTFDQDQELENEEDYEDDTLDDFSTEENEDTEDSDAVLEASVNKSMGADRKERAVANLKTMVGTDEAKRLFKKGAK